MQRDGQEQRGETDCGDGAREVCTTTDELFAAHFDLSVSCLFVLSKEGSQKMPPNLLLLRLRFSLNLGLNFGFVLLLVVVFVLALVLFLRLGLES